MATILYDKDGNAVTVGNAKRVSSMIAAGYTAADPVAGLEEVKAADLDFLDGPAVKKTTSKKK